MHLKQVWMSPDTGKKSRYAWRTLGGIVGIVAVTMLLICGGVFLSFSLHLPRERFGMALCCGSTGLAVILSLKLGQRSVDDATVFFLTEDDSLYAMDARRLSNHGHHVLDYAAGTIETQKFLRKLAKNPFVPAGADQILKVEGIKEHPTFYTVRCQVRHPNRQVIRQTYFWGKGLETEAVLLYQLERRRSWDNAFALTHNRNPFYIVVSAVICIGFTTLCVLSHPDLAQLPQLLYFPCLGAAFVSLCCLVGFIVRQHRGE